jgi:16S rRNA A1518/A1519 N6-dimethyltransferase RsmA/KsgA/DIM1 with predicted DNA glycosylase/AP lyase activity
VRAGFAMRRKTLQNNLAGVVAGGGPNGEPEGANRLGAEGARRLAAAAGIDGTSRPEQVPVAGWRALYQAHRAGATRAL